MLEPGKYYLRIKVTSSGADVDKPINTFSNFDLTDVVMKVPVNQEMKEYQLWQLFKTVLEENPDIHLNQYDLIDAWIWDKLLSTHPYRNRVTAIDWRFYEKLPVAPPVPDVPIVFDDMMDKILNMI